VWRSGTRRRRRSSWSGRSTALPRPAAMMVIRELLDDEDPPLHLLAYLCPRARSWRARSPPSPTSAPASVHSFVPVQGGGATLLRRATGPGPLQFHGGRRADVQVGTSSRRPSAPVMSPTGDEHERPRPHPQPLLQRKRASSPASIGGRASRPQPGQWSWGSVVGRHRRKRGGAPAAVAGAHGGSRPQSSRGTRGAPAVAAGARAGGA
jgi:hypothetical protein